MTAPADRPAWRVSATTCEGEIEFIEHDELAARRRAAILVHQGFVPVLQPTQEPVTRPSPYGLAVTGADESAQEAACWPANVPGFPAVGILWRDSSDGVVSFGYFGWPQDLIAAGAATAEMLAPAAQGRIRYDDNGYRFGVKRQYRLLRGAHRPWIEMTRCVPLDELDKLPGAREAYAAHERYSTWGGWDNAARTARQAQWRRLQGVVELGAPLPSRGSHLRLVVDNTREARP